MRGSPREDLSPQVDGPQRSKRAVRRGRCAAHSCRAVHAVRPMVTVEDDPALGAEQTGPAGGIAASILWCVLRRSDARRWQRSVVPVDGEKVDRETDWSERSDFVFDVGGDRLGGAGSEVGDEGRVARHGESESPLVYRDAPHVPAPRRWARRRPAGRESWSHSGLVRTRRSSSGSSARSHSGQFSGVPSRAVRSSASSTQDRTWKGGR